MWQPLMDSLRYPGGMVKLFWCDALILQFPLWWFGLPAILKSWSTSVRVGGRIYADVKWPISQRSTTNVGSIDQNQRATHEVLERAQPLTYK